MASSESKKHLALRTRQDNVTNEMLDGAELALWVPAWASYEEEQGRSFSGQQLENVAPKPPASVRAAAKRWAKKMQILNMGLSLRDLYIAASHAEGRAVNPHELGYYLMMQSLGHGVGWTDDHEPFSVKLPKYIEAIVFGRRGKSYDFGTSGI